MAEFERNYKEVSEYTQEEPGVEYDEKYLDEIYKAARDAGRSLTNEQRTNVLIYGSEHYAKASSRVRKNIERSFKIDLSNERKIRLTLNFMPTILDNYINNVLSFSPGCAIVPYQTDDTKQIKNAKLSQSVWGSIKTANSWSELSSSIVSDFFVIGEAWTNTYFDFDRGSIIGYEKVPIEDLPEEEQFQMDEMGQYILDEQGMPIPNEVDDETKPIFSGEVVTENVDGSSVFLEEGVTTFKDSAFVGIEKPIHRQTLRYMVMNDSEFTDEEKKEKLEALKANDGDTYMVWDRQAASIGENKDLLILVYFYYKPSPEFPNGKVFMMIKDKILWSLDLQKDKDGKPIFPINFKPCKRIPGCARGISLIRQGRSPQSEINRCISKMAEAQITLGDDKIVTNAGGAMTEGSKLQGIRHVKMEKMFDKITYIAGRTGEQYFPYLEGAIRWLHRVMGEPLDSNESAQSDMKATVYKSMKHKKRFLPYAKAIEEMFCDICHKSMELAKAYMPEEVVIQQIGSCEAINIEEFKDLGPMDYNIKIEPMTDDIDDTFARYMVTTEALQYAQDISPSQKGKIMSEFPWVDTDKMFGDTLIDEKEAENILLALDRGEMTPISKYDENGNILKAIVRRRRKADWATIKGGPSKIPNPQTGQPLTIEELYQVQYEQRVRIESKKTEEIRRANAGMIPMGGPLVDVAVYTNEPKKDGSGMKSERMKLPQDMINWVVDKAAKQEVAVDHVKDIGGQSQVDIMGSQNKPNQGGM